MGLPGISYLVRRSRVSDLARTLTSTRSSIWAGHFGFLPLRFWEGSNLFFSFFLCFFFHYSFFLFFFSIFVFLLFYFLFLFLFFFIFFLFLFHFCELFSNLYTFFGTMNIFWIAEHCFKIVNIFKFVHFNQNLIVNIHHIEDGILHEYLYH